MSAAARLGAALGAALIVWAATGEAGAATRVRLIATGGTIANAAAGRLTPDDLVRALPGGTPSGIEIDREVFANASSASLSLDDWLRLSRRVAAIFASDAALAGIVVTSGTDTLEELAFFLHLTVQDRRPVVVVGAMRRPGAPDADGPRNLSDAVRVAAAAGSRGRGTLVVMHGQVHAAVEVRKLHATRTDAFDAPLDVVAGTVGRRGVRYRADAAPRPAPGALDLGDLDALPRVDVLLTYQGATADLIEAAVNAGARGTRRGLCRRRFFDPGTGRCGSPARRKRRVRGDRLADGGRQGAAAGPGRRRLDLGR